MEKDTVIQSLRFLESNRTFLGREFLTWLWYQSEIYKHEFIIPGVGTVQLFIDDKLVLSSASGSVHESSLKGGTPAYAKEARAALFSGKLVQEAKFIMQYHDQQWMWTMKADDLAVRGLKMPAVQEPDSTNHMAKRIEHIEFLNEVIEALFKEYMSIRLSPKFANETQNMATWLIESQQKAL